MSNTMQYLAPPKSVSLAACHFQPGQRFQVAKIDPADLHSAWYVVMPGGSMLTFNNCADDAWDEAQANWVASACNDALALQDRPMPPAGRLLAWYGDGE